MFLSRVLHKLTQIRTFLILSVSLLPADPLDSLDPAVCSFLSRFGVKLILGDTYLQKRLVK